MRSSPTSRSGGRKCIAAAWPGRWSGATRTASSGRTGGWSGGGGRCGRGRGVPRLGVGWRAGSGRRRAEGALRQQGEWLRVTLASRGDAVLTTDIRGRVTFLHPVGESLTGWGQEQAQGQPLDAVFPILHE